MKVSMTVNGVARENDVEPRTLLVQYVREHLGLTGTNIGCDTSSCGACTIHVNGESVKSCTMLAVQADGATITTIEGLAKGDTMHPKGKYLVGLNKLSHGRHLPVGPSQPESSQLVDISEEKMKLQIGRAHV